MVADDTNLSQYCITNKLSINYKRTNFKSRLFIDNNFKGTQQIKYAASNMSIQK